MGSGFLGCWEYICKLLYMSDLFLVAIEPLLGHVIDFAVSYPCMGDDDDRDSSCWYRGGAGRVSFGTGKIWAHVYSFKEFGVLLSVVLRWDLILGYIICHVVDVFKTVYSIQIIHRIRNERLNNLKLKS